MSEEGDAIAKRIEQMVTAENADGSWATAYVGVKLLEEQKETNNRLDRLVKAIDENELDHTSLSQRLSTIGVELSRIRYRLETNSDVGQKAWLLCNCIAAVADDLDAIVADGVTPGAVAKAAGEMRRYSEELINLCGQ
jgi:hypothetical protein